MSEFKGRNGIFTKKKEFQLTGVARADITGIVRVKIMIIVTVL